MEGEDQCDIRFRHITEITILTVQLIVEFAKRLPGFDKLLREDQIALLKVGHVISIALRRHHLILYYDCDLAFFSMY